jgi:hypothetical protein
MIRWVGLLALAGCAATACKVVGPVADSQPDAPVVEHIIVVDAPPATALLGTYADAVTRERRIVPRAKASTIYRIIALDAAARKALAPIRRRHHVATAAESEKAVTAVGTLENYVSGLTP